MYSGEAMVEEKRHIQPEPPRASREPLGVLNPPGPLPNRPSTIPPPPLPVVQPQPIPLIPKKPYTVDEDCVTRRCSVDVFHAIHSPVSSPIDAEESLDSIQITPEDTPQVAYKQSLFDIDEDAVTKEIRIRRVGETITGISTSITDHEAAMRIRTLPSDDTLWKSRQTRRSPNPSEPSRLGFLRTFVPALLAVIEKATSSLRSTKNAIQPIVGGSRFRGLKKHSTSKNEKRQLRLSVNSYTRDLYREIRNALNPASAGEVLRVGTEEYAIAVAEPPKIAVNALLLRRSDKYSLLIRGKATHPVAIRDIMVFADKKKILYLSNAMRDDAGYMEFSADVPLLSAVSSVLVVARHDDAVMGSQSLVISKSN